MEDTTITRESYADRMAKEKHGKSFEDACLDLGREHLWSPEQIAAHFYVTRNTVLERCRRKYPNRVKIHRVLLLDEDASNGNP